MYYVPLCSWGVSFRFFSSVEYGVLPRQKRRYASGSINKDTLAIYHKLTEVVEVLALLLETQLLTDITVLQVYTNNTPCTAWSDY